MKILQIAPIIERVPPKKYGGTERVVHILTEELVKRGHDVTLFASGDSQTSAKLVSVYPRPLREDKVDDLYGPNVWTLLNIGMAYQKQDEFDIIHDHNSHLSLPTANISTTPVVMTLHGAFTPSTRRLFETLRNVNLVTLSKSQSIPAPHLNYVGNVYHGLDIERYPFSKNHDGYLLYVGRFSPQKGAHHAIEVAQFLQMPLILAAKLDQCDLPYFKEYIEPKLSDSIRWVGEVDQEERNALMSKAYCLLHPVMWREPFGLTLIEAMATGCPVIAFKRGSIPEIIFQGKTGFYVEDVEEMIEYVGNIVKINRMDCREHVTKNFNTQKMVEDYESIYQKLIKRHKATIKENGLSLSTPYSSPSFSSLITTRVE